MGFCQAMSMMCMSFTTEILSEVISGDSDSTIDIWKQVENKMRLPKNFNVGIHFVLIALFFYSFIDGVELV